jgi:hypothetical protein
MIRAAMSLARKIVTLFYCAFLKKEVWPKSEIPLALARIPPGCGLIGHSKSRIVIGGPYPQIA